jgi:hypothetical protein
MAGINLPLWFWAFFQQCQPSLERAFWHWWCFLALAFAYLSQQFSEVFPGPEISPSVRLLRLYWDRVTAFLGVSHDLIDDLFPVVNFLHFIWIAVLAKKKL